ncbi:MAG: hypothetical protein LBH25_02655 [Fibromonadaceae bacterium]|jgi:hypothetical protein|nr:hypothetical protein [Fibromonadaceae bacterium]
MGNLATEHLQIRLTQKFGSTEIAVAARKDIDYPAVEGRIGTITPIKIGASAFWASKEMAGASRESGDSYNIYEEDDDDEPAWGIAADMFATIGIVSISGEFFMGKDLSNYGGIPARNGYLYRNAKSMGGWGALGIKASDNLSFNAGAGVERITNPDHLYEYYLSEYYRWPEAIYFNRAIFANVNYKLSPTATLALEYFRHDSEYIPYEKGAYNRVETAVTYGF